MNHRASAAGIMEGRDPSTGAFAKIGMAVLLASYGVNAMDRTLFPMMLTDVRREYAFTLPEAGLMSTVFTIGMALAGVLTGYLMSRYSRKAVVQTGIFIFSAVTIATVVSAGFVDMLFYRAVTGIGEAMQLTALLAVVSSYLAGHRGAGIGAVNSMYGIGAIIGPALGANLLIRYGSWRAPMIGFGLIGFLLMALIAIFVRPWLSEVNRTGGNAEMAFTGGAGTLRNMNTAVLVFLSMITGLSMYGFLGMYPTFLREYLHYSPADTGKIMSAYGLGALASLGGGWIGDRFPPRHVLGFSFPAGAIIGYLLFNGPGNFLVQAALAFAFGVVFAGTIYVNVAAYHVRSVRGALSGRAAGVFVSSYYASASISGYTIGWLAKSWGWRTAGDVQLALLCLIGAAATFLLRPERMAERRS
jgi:MFS transporter, DHA1 family, inner membrane transport protein